MAKKSKNSAGGEADSPVLVLTGQMRDDMHLIRVYGRDVWLPRDEFQAIVMLAHGTLTKGKGVTLSSATIQSLRARIDGALGQPGVGVLLIPEPD